MRRAARTAVAALAAAVAASGCGPGGIGSQPGTGAPSGQPADAYLCHGDEIPPEALEDGRPATGLGEDARAALDGQEVPPVGDLATWTVVTEEDDALLLVRELAEPEERGDGRVDTHERLSVERFGPPAGDGDDDDDDDDDDANWLLRSFGPCDLQRDLGDLGAADVALDPGAAPPRPDATEVDVLVNERACASGEPADGRVLLVALERTDAELRLVVGVEPRPGGQTCPSNPPTPFTIELDEPLGERTITDASVHPPRELTPAEPH